LKNQHVLLRENVDSLGQIGDVVRVKPGFARNFLLPRGLAIPATQDNIRAMDRRRARLDAEEAQRAAEIERVANQMGGIRVETEQRADETGSLYGSVSAGQIAELLAAAGHPISERRIRLDHPLKSVGEHEVQVHVHGDRNATVTVVVKAATAG
jgi:large subunit ribosomal protein L9